MHWLSKYVGMEVVPGGRGPESVDCWGLLRLVYSREHGIELPDYPGISKGSLSRIVNMIQTQNEWISSASFDGCAVAMGQGKDVVHHVGIWTSVDGGKVIHADERAGYVVADKLSRLQRMQGFRVFRFYRHIKWPT